MRLNDPWTLVCKWLGIASYHFFWETWEFVEILEDLKTLSEKNCKDFVLFQAPYIAIEDVHVIHGHESAM